MSVVRRKYEQSAAQELWVDQPFRKSSSFYGTHR